MHINSFKYFVIIIQILACPNGSVSCAEGGCVTRHELCDGINQCQNGEDERLLCCKS